MSEEVTDVQTEETATAVDVVADSAEEDLFGREKIGKILLKTAPPVMFAQLIQALYNIVDSFFVGHFSDTALKALSVIYPFQFIAIALAVGTGVGVNTYMARKFALHDDKSAYNAAGTGVVLAVCGWAFFSLFTLLFLRLYATLASATQEVVNDSMTYGLIVCIGSLGTFLEGNFSKVLQAKGNMRRPMIAQVAGALTNVVLDPLFINGWGFIPQMGVAGAAIATVIGQFVSAIIVGVKAFHMPPKQRFGHYVRRIYRYGYSNILMQLLFTVYIVGLNFILARFNDEAVTVLGLYYKWQSFFFVPLFGLQTCIVPIISYNYARAAYDRCRAVMRDSMIISVGFMALGFVCFVFFPKYLIAVFSDNPLTLELGQVAFPIIGSSFFSAAFSLMMPVFFQAIGGGKRSVLLSLTRQIFCLLPLFGLFSMIGVNYTWLAFPISETIAGGVGVVLYILEIKRWKKSCN